VDWREIARLAPDVIRLVKRLAADPGVPRATRWWLIGLLCYLLLPFDLIPDFLPVIGFADDAIAIMIALRCAVHHAGEEAIVRHWPGTHGGSTASCHSPESSESCAVRCRPPPVRSVRRRGTIAIHPG
jgi:uncharacterized membrane protein YkvA (DUF1232 family)